MRRSVLLVIVAVLGTLLVAAPAGRAAEPVVEHGYVTSVEGAQIWVTVFEPTGPRPAPVVLDSHGWGGSRRTEVDGTVQALLDAGFGVVSIDQRGHGESGGKANVQDPDFEVRDIVNVVDAVAELPWVALEAPGDPVMGAIGGSYGGGYQTMTALWEQRNRAGGTRFDALVPQITWYDLPESLAPQDVPRSLWVTALYAAGASMVADYIHQGFAEGAATGTFPQWLKDEFATHSPKWFTDRGVRLDIPVLFRQGASDNLFDLSQGLENFDAMLTPAARARSRFVSYNGGHALPTVVPPGQSGGSIAGGLDEAADSGDPNAAFASGGDACSGEDGFLPLSVEFLRRALLGVGDPASVLPTTFNLTGAAGDTCVRVDALPAATAVEGVDVTTGSASQYVPLAQGPVTVAGVPRLRTTLTALGVDVRFFAGLAVGTTPADAQIVQNNLLPVRQAEPVVGRAITAELPGVAVVVPEGQTLYLVLTPVSDIFVMHGSRTPGAAILEQVVVDLPVLTTTG